MLKNSLKIVISCFAGAFIGSLVALELAGNFWFIGLLIGACVGYLSYDMSAFPSAIKFAWKKASTPSELTVAEKKQQRKLFRAYVRSVFHMCVYMGGMLSYIMLIFVGVLDLSSSIEPGITLYSWLVLSIVIIVFAHVVVSIIALLSLSTWLFRADKTKLTPSIIESNKYGTYAKYGNFIIAPFTAVYYAVKTIPWMMSTVMNLLFLAGRFIKYVFVFIHSDIRVLCALDAAIGAAVGYYMGSALIGGVAGAVLGLANYELISKRILQVVPSEEKR